MAGQDRRNSTGATSQYRDRNSTADRALDILGLFAPDRLLVTGQEVATELGSARSTAYRYLQSLVATGFIEESHQGGFRLGPRVLELARLARKGYGLSEVSLPVMDDLCQRMGETVLLTRRAGGNAVCLERSEPDHPARVSYERGSILPINAGASALVLLAWLPGDQVEALLTAHPLVRFTSKTLTEVDQLTARLATIREEGYCVSRGELDENIVGIAAPVRDSRGNVAAALSLAAFEPRLPPQRLPEVAGAVLEAAVRISDALALAEA